MHKKIGWASLAVFSLALAGAGAASADKDQPAKKTQTTTTTSAACPTDDASKLKSVLSFLHTANQSEIKHAKLAADRAQTTDVKQFADRMNRDHSDADKKLTDLAMKKGIDLNPMQPVDPVHAALMNVDSKMEQSLQSKKGAMFDASYIAPEAMEHQLILSVIEEGQKVAKDDEVKKLLNDMHSTISQHKEQASNIIDKLKSMGAGAAIGGGPSEPGTPEKTQPEKPLKGKTDKGTMQKGSKTPSGTGGGPSSGSQQGGSSSGDSGGSSGSEMNK